MPVYVISCGIKYFSYYHVSGNQTVENLYMNNYGFVVLNYNNYVDTIECVSSLLKIKRSDYIIVIVDNSSKNESIDKLCEYFYNNRNVVIISTPSNLGYSGGNNFGIKWLRDRSINKIIIATNDTILISENILDIFDSLDLNNIGIVGPNILSLDGTLQNPSLVKPNIIYLLNLYCYRSMKYIRSIVYRLLPITQKFRDKYLIRQKMNITLNKLYNQSPAPTFVYMLHGCFLYLTEAFINRYGFLDDNIFMYCEEDLMSWQCEKASLLRLYIPIISVIHKERKSTKSVYNDEVNVFIEKNTLESQEYLKHQVSLLALLKVIAKYRFSYSL